MPPETNVAPFPSKLTIPASSVIDQRFADAAKRVSTLELPAKIAYRLGKVLQVLETEARGILGARLKVFKDLGVEKDGGYEIIPENRENAEAQLGGLLSEKVELPLSEKLVLPDSVNITAQEALLLEPLIAFE